MHSNRYELGNRLRDFKKYLAGIDWQIGITTTALGRNALNGGLVKSSRGEKILGPNTSRVEEKFDDMISFLDCNDSDSLAWTQSPCTIANEQPLLSTLAAFDHSDNRQLLRKDVNTAVIYISDEDETPSPGSGPATDPQEIIDAYKQKWGSQQRLKSFGIIIPPGNQQCLQQETQPFSDPGAQYGYAIDLLTRLTLGQTQSICDQNYKMTWDAVARHASTNPSTLLKEFTLKYTPILGTVSVTASPNVSLNWRVVGKTVIFNPAPPSGTRIQISYKHL
jgi:hypothetical protein